MYLAYLQSFILLYITAYWHVLSIFSGVWPVDPHDIIVGPTILVPPLANTHTLNVVSIGYMYIFFRRTVWIMQTFYFYSYLIVIYDELGQVSFSTLYNIMSCINLSLNSCTKSTASYRLDRPILLLHRPLLALLILEAQRHPKGFFTT
jgi:hypothetical protein